MRHTQHTSTEGVKVKGWKKDLPGKHGPEESQESSIAIGLRGLVR